MSPPCPSVAAGYLLATFSISRSISSGSMTGSEPSLAEAEPVSVAVSVEAVPPTVTVAFMPESA